MVFYGDETLGGTPSLPSAEEEEDECKWEDQARRLRNEQLMEELNRAGRYEQHPTVLCRLPPAAQAQKTTSIIRKRVIRIVEEEPQPQ
ncbi:hypothetical protein AGOR_G00138560 [Albula goreensis]|uniref:Uncharacterized protein n=1 Tax=Albula goreensis TaxID=1534307 RepID=A0A8T3DDA4_9TELE|nr:hypothetical protein AGOR_G00138560 [Albula goreensis]